MSPDVPWELSVWEVAEAEKLSDVRVAEAGHQLALLQIFAHHLTYPLIL